MNSILKEILKPTSWEEFERAYLFKEPFAAPFSASRFKDFISWQLIWEIIFKGHQDCWLPFKGKLPDDASLATGRMTFEQALSGFRNGRTILIRHSEQAHPKLKEIADDFYKLFKDPVDIQIYCTPAGGEGFDWHYDQEEVFVIQCGGEKEFRLLKNSDPAPEVFNPGAGFDLGKQSTGYEIRCLLKPGDWLYIPAGYWHKAQALSPSFHMSVGVMSSRAYGRSKVSLSELKGPKNGALKDKYSQA